MDDLGPATSEWVVTSGAAVGRYSATPDDAQRALLGNNGDFRAHDPAEIVPVLNGACTQVLLRKALNGSYTLLFNGCVSVVGDDGYHVLPSFRMDEQISEDATGREVPAPVVVSVLVEDGACAPESVTLQVRQRTFVAGAQINEGKEPVLMETKVQPTRPSEVVSRAVAVAYPMSIGPSATVTFVDREAKRDLAKKELKIKFKLVKKAMGGILKGSKFTGVQIGQILNKVLSNPRVLVSGLLGGGAYAWYIGSNGRVHNFDAFTKMINDALKPVIAEMGSNVTVLPLLKMQLGLKFMEYAYYQLWYNDLEEQTQQAAKDKAYTVSVFDLPAILRRVAGLQPGGAYSNGGVGWTLKELREAGRLDDLAVMEYLLQPEKLTPEAMRDAVFNLRRQMMDNEPDPGQIDQDRQDEIDAARDEFEKSLAQLNKSSDPTGDVLQVTNTTRKVIETRGYAETTFTIVVVDASRDASATRETYHLRSDQSFSAGLVAAGYNGLQRDLDKAKGELLASMGSNSAMLNTQWITWATTPLMTLKYGKVTGKLGTDLLNWYVGLNRDVIARTEEEVRASLLHIQITVVQALTALMNTVEATLASTVATPAVVRYLPHVVRMRSAGQGAFETEQQNEQVQLAVAGEPSMTSSTGLRDALKASRDTMRTARQAVSQFVEREGLAGPRMRTQLAMNASAPGTAVTLDDGVSVFGGGGAPRAVGITTRHAYAPRMPADVTGALACREEHAQLREATIIGWLTAEVGSGSAKGIAEALGLPPTHVGELVLGVLADLATDDVLERAPNHGQLVSPTGAQLMAGAVQRAVARLRVAHRLATAAFQNGPPKTRLNDDDALFACYPEGATFQMLLRESAIWREWQEAWSRETPALPRHDTHAAAAVAAPMGVVALKQLLDAAGKVRAADVSLDSFPFLAPQTLFMHTHEALAIFGTRNAGSERVRARALAALAVHVEHSYQAAQRLHVMATALLASPGSQARLLRDCARARPVLQQVPMVYNLNNIPATYRNAIDLFRQNVAPLQRDLQRNLPATPTRSTLWNRADPAHRKALEARRAAMRFDVDALSRRRAMEEDPDALLDSFAKLRLVAGTDVPAQYLVPFGAAVNKGRYPLMGRFFENLPVYVGLLPSTTQPLPAPPSGAGHVTPRRAHDTQDNHNPFVITTNGGKGVNLVLRPALVNVKVLPAATGDSSVTIPVTLAEALVSNGSTNVDASNAFLFNVERLVQCALLMAANDPECEALIVSPPSPPTVKLVDIPPPPAPSQLLRLTERRIDFILASLTSNQVALDALGDMLGVENTDIESLLQALTLDKNVASEQEGALRAQVEERMNEFAINANLNQAARVKDLVDSFSSRYRLLLTSESAQDKTKLATYEYFETVRYELARQLEESQVQHTKTWAAAEDENNARIEKAHNVHCRELDLWPSLVSVADAVVRGIVAEPPRLHAATTPSATICSTPKPVDYFTNAVDEWVSVGLKVVPLCELAAVLVGV